MRTGRCRQRWPEERFRCREDPRRRATDDAGPGAKRTARCLGCASRQASPRDDSRRRGERRHSRDRPDRRVRECHPRRRHRAQPPVRPGRIRRARDPVRPRRRSDPGHAAATRHADRAHGPSPTPTGASAGSIRTPTARRSRPTACATTSRSTTPPTSHRSSSRPSIPAPRRWSLPRSRGCDDSIAPWPNQRDGDRSCGSLPRTCFILRAPRCPMSSSCRSLSRRARTRRRGALGAARPAQGAVISLLRKASYGSFPGPPSLSQSAAKGPARAPGRCHRGRAEPRTRSPATSCWCQSHTPPVPCCRSGDNRSAPGASRLRSRDR